MFKYFRTSIIVTVLGLLLVGGIAWYQEHSSAVIFQSVFTAVLLAVLEISLSFDNAVVNATVMKKMSEVWKKRFLTWGMLIAVFGMRLLFPLAIVSILAQVTPWDALKLSIYDAEKYAEIMKSSHIYVSAFGGMFLLMVFVHFFINEEKEIHWFSLLEKPLAKSAQFNGIELMIAIAALMGFSHVVHTQPDQHAYLVSGLWGILTFMGVHGIAGLLEHNEIIEDSGRAVASAGLGTFLYLEILDASFSFDGVIGAFALTNSLFLIMIGLGIGAFFVRSLTIYFVEKNTVDQFRYLEHGAFYALGALALLMLLDPVLHVPEWITGLCGAVILAGSIIHSIAIDKKKPRSHAAK